MPVAGVAQANINKRMNSSFLIIVSFSVDWWLTKDCHYVECQNLECLVLIVNNQGSRGKNCTPTLDLKTI